jgi:serine/threonine-protein kinase HipA
MSSEPGAPVFVWVWLPGAREAVVAGRLDRADAVVTFTYGRSYLDRPDAIALYLPELPLRRGQIAPRVGEVAGCIADSAPDAWGQRVILHRHTSGRGIDPAELGLLTYLLESGSDRIGALDFQTSPSAYRARATTGSLDDLVSAAGMVEEGIPLPDELDRALVHGSSVGGARPKALLRNHGRSLIAKFSSTADIYPIVRGEYLAMELAHGAGLSVASVELTRSLSRDVLLIERFDRPPDGSRRAMVSALTMLELDEWGGRYASYADLAEIIRHRFRDPDLTLRELFSRITFNILVGNNDDHARNHAAFWDGEMLEITPAYDITPTPRSGRTSQQAMSVGMDGWRWSRLGGCVERASTYHLHADEAREIIDHQIETIARGWEAACDRAQLTQAERRFFWRRQFLNPFAFEDYETPASVAVGGADDD